MEHVKQKPEISQQSKLLTEKVNKGSFDNVHERLFYRGIESLKRKEELMQIEFGRSHPFRPITNNASSKIMVNKSDIDKLVYSYKDKDLVLTRKKYISETFDPNDGKKLYKPRINKSTGVKHKFSLKEIQQWRDERKEMIDRLKQLFDFLDSDKDGFISSSSLDYENIHPDLVNLLVDVLSAIDQLGDVDINFSDFSDLIMEADLQASVEDIFFYIDGQPLINPRPLKERNFKFNN